MPRLPLRYAAHPGFMILLFLASSPFRFEDEPLPSTPARVCASRVYSLTQNALSPFHAEPTHSPVSSRVRLLVWRLFYCRRPDVFFAIATHMPGWLDGTLAENGRNWQDPIQDRIARNFYVEHRQSL